MNKITFWSILMLLSLSMSLVACGSDGGSEIEETDEQKFFRLANIKEENFDKIIPINYVSDSYFGFFGFQKDKEVFRFWLVNRITNKITECVMQMEMSYKVYKGYGVYVDYQLRKQHVNHTIYDTKVGKLIQFEIGYYDSEGNLAGHRDINYLFNNNEQILSLNNPKPRFYLGERIGKEYSTFDWYNNSLAFEFAPGVSSNSSENTRTPVVIIVSQEGKIVKTFNNSFASLIDSGINIVEVYDYDRALFWGLSWKYRTGGESVNYSEDYEGYLVIYFFNLNKKQEVNSFYNYGTVYRGGFGIPLNSFVATGRENDRYETEIISSDSRYCTFRITRINYAGQKKDIVVKADKQNDTAEIVN